MAGEGGLTRSPSVALEHLDAFEARLGLGPEQLEERAELFRQAPETLFRATPALFVADVRGPFAEAATLFERPAPELVALGDPHLGNFGILPGPAGDPVYAPNDFDQSGIASPEVDLARLAASARLIARALGSADAEGSRIVQELAVRYFDALALREPPVPPYLTAGEVSGPVKRRLQKASGVTRAQLLDKWTESGADGRRRFARADPVRALPLVEETFVRAALGAYGEVLAPGAPLELLDVVEKRESGTSSRGLPRYLALVQPGGEGELPVILDLKVLLPVALHPEGAPRGNAVAVVARQKAMGALFDPLSAGIDHQGRSFLIRERPPAKKNVKLKHLEDAGDLHAVALQAAEVLARAHARTQDLAAALLTWVGGELARGAQRLDAFSAAYADQIEADHAALRRR